ncbi:MAG: SCO family protein, partial [Nitrospira sp.]|nr:SCO family protein [Nitrospira sp.]
LPVMTWPLFVLLGWLVGGLLVGGLMVKRVMAEEVPNTMVAIDCPDVPVQDQQGHTGSFHQVTGDRLVILTFTYGTCRTACPIVNGLLASVYHHLGPRVGRDVVVVSVSVDPEHDRPEQLAAHHRTFGDPLHWYRLTGDRTDLARLWRAFGIRVGGDPAAHSSDLFIGSPVRRTWRRVSGLLSPQSIVQVLDDTERVMGH